MAAARINAQAAMDRSDGASHSGNLSLDISGDESAVKFATVQLFAAIYLEKLAVGPLSFQISLPILIMLGHIGIMLISGRMQFVPLRLGLYLLFASTCLLSQAISGARFSIPSVVELLLLYSFWTVTSFVSEAAYQLILKRFIALMIVPAVIVLVQFFYQKITGLSDPISMNKLVPKSVLLQGYFYDAHYPWNSPFQRPNGFFFLEPSTVSLFTAAAAIIELTYFRRARYVILMIGATAFSMGGTGVTMLLLASPFLLARQSLPVILLVVVAALAGLSAMVALNIPIPMLSRVNELHEATTSGGGRILIPAQQFLRLLFDPSHFLTGTGAGSTTAEFGNAWPVLKLLNEYGLLASIFFVALYVAAIARSYNVPLAVSISVMFHFTGGYLLDAMDLQLMGVIFCMVVPVSLARQGTRHRARDHRGGTELPAGI